MRTDPGLLKRMKFFDSCSESQLDKVADMCTTREFKVKDILFEQYDKLSEVYILTEGRLSLGISLPHDKRIQLGTIEEGQLFSWSAVFAPYISTAWVMAITPAKVIAINAEKLNELIGKDCDFGLRIMSRIADTISRRLHDTRFQLMNQLTLL